MSEKLKIKMNFIICGLLLFGLLFLDFKYPEKKDIITKSHICTDFKLEKKFIRTHPKWPNLGYYKNVLVCIECGKEVDYYE